MTPERKRPPLQGEIWFVKIPTDPPEKGIRPVVVVSIDARNRHEKASTVLVVPLTTTIHKEVPTHVYLSTGETGLLENSSARAEDITVVSKERLEPPRQGLRTLSRTRIAEIADKIRIAMGV